MAGGFNYARRFRTWKRILKIPKYILRIPRNISKPSYYPEMERKSKSEMWWDNFKWILKNRELSPFYTSYGLDVKNFRNSEDFIPTPEFWESIKEGNRKPIKTAYGSYNYLALLRDKYVFSSFITGTIGSRYVPKTIALIDGGQAFRPQTGTWQSFADFCAEDGKSVFKVVDGTFGNDVFIADIRDGQVTAQGESSTPEAFVRRLGKKRFIVQELIVQHPALQAFGTSCVNTIRTITVRGKSGKISVFAAFLRVGTDTESFVDNRAKGGLAVGVDLETGKLMKYGFPHARFGTKLDVHPLSGIVFEGYQLPYWEQTVELVCGAHRQFPALQSIGWDVAITADGPLFLEGNDTWEIGGPQDTCGGLRKRWEELTNA